jgi:hypothetical protein
MNAIAASALRSRTNPSRRECLVNDPLHPVPEMGKRRMGVCSKCRVNKAILESDMIQECSRLALLGPHPSRSQACSSDHR